MNPLVTFFQYIVLAAGLALRLFDYNVAGKCAITLSVGIGIGGIAQRYFPALDKGRDIR